jgi:hypothetical protein
MDEHRATWKDKLRHDWAFCGADAFRYLALTWREIVDEPPEKKINDILAEIVRVMSDFDQLAR